MELVKAALCRRPLPWLLTVAMLAVVLTTGWQPVHAEDHGVILGQSGQRHCRQRPAGRSGGGAGRAPRPRCAPHPHNRCESGRNLHVHGTPNGSGSGVFRPCGLRRSGLHDGRHWLQRPIGSRDDAHDFRDDRSEPGHLPAISRPAPPTPDRGRDLRAGRDRRHRARRPDLPTGGLYGRAATAQVRRARRRVRPAAGDRIPFG